MSKPQKKLLDQVREKVRLRRISEATTTMIYTYVLNKGGACRPQPAGWLIIRTRFVVTNGNPRPPITN